MNEGMDYKQEKKTELTMHIWEMKGFPSKGFLKFKNIADRATWKDRHLKKNIIKYYYQM